MKEAHKYGKVSAASAAGGFASFSLRAFPNDYSEHLGLVGRWRSRRAAKRWSAQADIHATKSPTDSRRYDHLAPLLLASVLGELDRKKTD